MEYFTSLHPKVSVSLHFRAFEGALLEPPQNTREDSQPRKSLVLKAIHPVKSGRMLCTKSVYFSFFENYILSAGAFENMTYRKKSQSQERKLMFFQLITFFMIL